MARQAFRERERAAIAQFCGGARLAGGDALVLALGGGAIEDAATRSLLLTAPEMLLVHLEVALATTLARCRGTEHLRPILADEANLASRYAQAFAALPHGARVDCRGRAHAGTGRGRGCARGAARIAVEESRRIQSQEKCSHPCGARGRAPFSVISAIMGLPR